MSSVASDPARVPEPRKRARDKILEAAEELARVVGPGNLSLDAVAARAGVSKGGLLYHFPNKAALLKALVGQFVTSLDRNLRTREARSEGAPDSLICAFLDIMVGERRCHQPPPSGLLAALGEDPHLLAPVRDFDRSFIDRMKANSADPTLALVVFLALQGMKSQRLLNIDSVDEAEFKAVVARLYDLIGKTMPADRPQEAESDLPSPAAQVAGRRRRTTKSRAPGKPDSSVPDEIESMDGR